MLGVGVWVGASPRNPSTETTTTLGGGGGVGAGVGAVGTVGATAEWPPHAVLRTTRLAPRRGKKAAKRLKTRGTLRRMPWPRPGRIIEVPEDYSIGFTRAL